MSDAERTLPPASAEAPGIAPGARLAQERQLRNLSLADVARQLKLSVNQVEALEAGHYHGLPGPVYVRGFIRNYARLLGLDPDALVHSAGESLPRQASRPEMPPSQDIPFPSARARRWPRYATAGALILGGLALYEFYWGEPAVVVTRPVAVTPEPISTAPQPPGLAQAPAQPRPETAAAAPPPAAETQTARPAMTASAAAAPTARDAAPPAAAEPSGGLETVPRPGERQVQLIFEEESWVEIRDRSGEAIFSKLNRPGTRQLVTGAPPLAIVVGNAHGVRLIYGDQPVDLSRYTKADVARLTLE